MHPVNPHDEPQDQITCSSLSMRDQRSLLLHVLYALESSDYESSPEAVMDNFAKGYQCVISQSDAVYTWSQAIVAEREQLDNEIKPLLDNWRFERIGCCTKLILRMAIWEMKNTETAPLIIINEAIELAKCFAETDAYKFINGILDEWVKQHKPISDNQSAS